MAEFLQVPYGAVVVASILPAILYYAALYFHVDLQAARQGIGGVEAASASARRELWRRGWHFIVPIIFLAFALIEPAALGLSAGKAALAAAALQLVLAGWRDPQRTAWRTRTIVELFAQAGRSSVEIILIAAAAGMLVGMISISGIAFAITLQLLALAGHSLPLLLMLAAALAWVLGMGMPTVSVYILTATLLAPALVQLGLSPMAAHMFVLYNGMLSMITPPVALAAYAAAQLAGESGWKTGWEACRVGWSTFVLPFLFAAMPGLLFEAPPTTALADLARSLLGIYLGTAAVVGYEAAPLNRARRLAFAAAAIMVAMPMQAFDGAVWLSAVGLLLGALLIYMERRGRGTAGAKPA